MSRDRNRSLRSKELLPAKGASSNTQEDSTALSLYQPIPFKHTESISNTDHIDLVNALKAKQFLINYFTNEGACLFFLKQEYIKFTEYTALPAKFDHDQLYNYINYFVQPMLDGTSLALGHHQDTLQKVLQSIGGSTAHNSWTEGEIENLYIAGEALETKVINQNRALDAAIFAIPGQIKDQLLALPIDTRLIKDQHNQALYDRLRKVEGAILGDFHPQVLYNNLADLQEKVRKIDGYFQLNGISNPLPLQGMELSPLESNPTPNISSLRFLQDSQHQFEELANNAILANKKKISAQQKQIEDLEIQVTDLKTLVNSLIGSNREQQELLGKVLTELSHLPTSQTKNSSPIISSSHYEQPEYSPSEIDINPILEDILPDPTVTDEYEEKVYSILPKGDPSYRPKFDEKFNSINSIDAFLNIFNVAMDGATDAYKKHKIMLAMPSKEWRWMQRKITKNTTWQETLEIIENHFLSDTILDIKALVFNNIIWKDNESLEDFIGQFQDKAALLLDKEKILFNIVRATAVRALARVPELSRYIEHSIVPNLDTLVQLLSVVFYKYPSNKPRNNNPKVFLTDNCPNNKRTESPKPKRAESRKPRSRSNISNCNTEGKGKST